MAYPSANTTSPGYANSSVRVWRAQKRQRNTGQFPLDRPVSTENAIAQGAACPAQIGTRIAEIARVGPLLFAPRHPAAGRVPVAQFQTDAPRREIPVQPRCVRRRASCTMARAFRWTSSAGISFAWPVSISFIRRSTSARQAISISGDAKSSTLAKSISASSTRSAGLSARAFFVSSLVCAVMSQKMRTAAHGASSLSSIVPSAATGSSNPPAEIPPLTPSSRVRCRTSR